MSDGDNSDFLDDPKAYEDEQSDVFSGLSRRGSESYNQPPEELNLRKQDSGAKNPNMVVDLKTRLRKNTSESSEPMPTRHDMPIPPPPMYNPPISHQMPPQQAVEHSGKPVVEIGMRLKSIYPQRYFIFKNMKPQHFKFCKENNYGITQKTNENTLKSAFENSENLLIIFSNTEQRSFLGYARMESDYFDAPEMIDNFTKNSGLTRVDFDNNFIFRIEWKSKNTLRYEFVNHIKNKYNENREVNHSKVFQEVDPNAGKALIALIENPPTEPVAEEPMEHSRRDEQPPMPFHNKPKTEGSFPPNNFMMGNPMMPPHFGYYPMGGPMNPMGGPMGAMGMGPMGGQPGMFPMPGQPGMMKGGPQQFPYNMNYNDYYMNMQQQHQQQQQQMMKQNKDKGRRKSASSSGSSSRSSSGSSRSSSPKKGAGAKGGRRDSKSASRSRSKSHKRQNKMEKRGGNPHHQKDYQKGGRKYDNNNPNPNYPNQNNRNNNNNKFQKYDKFDKNNNYNQNKNNNYRDRGGNNNPHNRRRNSRSISPNSRNSNKNRFNNNKSQRRSHSRSEEDRRRHTPEHREEEPQPETTHHQQETNQSPIIPQRERSLSNHNEEDPFDFGDMEDRISEAGNDNRKIEEERQDSPHAFDEDIRPGKKRSASRSNKRSGSASSSKSVTESKSTTTKNQDTDFRDNSRKKKFSREDEPLVITKGNNKIIGGKGGTERLIIGKPNKHNKGRSPDRSDRYERHDRHDRYDRNRHDRNYDRRKSSRDRERNSSNRKSREREASKERRDFRRDNQRERRDEKRDEPRERRDEGYESKPKETPRRDREPERSVESSETKGRRIDLRERLSQKDSIAPGPGAGSITNRIIKKN